MTKYQPDEDFCGNTKIFEMERKGGKLLAYVPCFVCRAFSSPLLEFALHEPVKIHRTEGCAECGFRIKEEAPEAKVAIVDSIILPVAKKKGVKLAIGLRRILDNIVALKPDDGAKLSVENQRKLHSSVFDAVSYLCNLCGLWLPDFESMRNYGWDDGGEENETLRIELEPEKPNSQKFKRRTVSNISVKFNKDDTNIWYNDAFTSGVPGWQKAKSSPTLSWQSFEGGQKLNVTGLNLRPYKGIVQSTFISNRGHNSAYRSAVRRLVSYASKGGSSWSTEWLRWMRVSSLSHPKKAFRLAGPRPFAFSHASALAQCCLTSSESSCSSRKAFFTLHLDEVES